MFNLPSHLFIILVPQVAPDATVLQPEVDIVREELRTENHPQGMIFVHRLVVKALKSADDVTIMLVELVDDATRLVHHRYQVMLQAINNPAGTTFIPKEHVFAVGEEIAHAFKGYFDSEGDSFGLMRARGVEYLTVNQWIVTQQWEAKQRAKLVGLEIKDFKLMPGNKVEAIYGDGNLSDTWESAINEAFRD
jgi:hypothetical protein